MQQVCRRSVGWLTGAGQACAAHPLIKGIHGIRGTHAQESTRTNDLNNHNIVCVYEPAALLEPPCSQQPPVTTVCWRPAPGPHLLCLAAPGGGRVTGGGRNMSKGEAVDVGAQLKLL